MKRLFLMLIPLALLAQESNDLVVVRYSMPYSNFVYLQSLMYRQPDQIFAIEETNWSGLRVGGFALQGPSTNKGEFFVDVVAKEYQHKIMTGTLDKNWAPLITNSPATASAYATFTNRWKPIAILSTNTCSKEFPTPPTLTATSSTTEEIGK